MSAGLAIAISAFLLVANALFVGAEFALISARRSEIEPRAEAGGRAANITLRAIEDVLEELVGEIRDESQRLAV